MKTYRAEHFGMCFGVRDAIALAFQQAQAQSLTVLGELVHNETVIAQLQERGIRIEARLEAVTTPNAMITAHGASDRMLRRAEARGLRVTEATCPLVRLVHRSVANLVREGYHPIIIGKADHVEVRGLTEDLAAYDVVLTEADIAALAERPRFGVVAQTTQAIDKVRSLVDRIRQRFPRSEIRFIDTVCLPTKQRQAAAIELAQQVEAMVVIGGAYSNNTRELADTCRRACPRVFQVQTAADLRPEWFAGVQSVGITAGTSTPDAVIDAVESWLHEIDPAHCVATGQVA